MSGTSSATVRFVSAYRTQLTAGVLSCPVSAAPLPRFPRRNKRATNRWSSQGSSGEEGNVHGHRAVFWGWGRGCITALVFLSLRDLGALRTLAKMQTFTLARTLLNFAHLHTHGPTCTCEDAVERFLAPYTFTIAHLDTHGTSGTLEEVVLQGYLAHKKPPRPRILQ